MNREAQDNLLLLTGAMVLQLALTDLHLRYVKPEMQPLLLITGAGLAGVGLHGVVRQYRRLSRSATKASADVEAGADGTHDGGHGHSHAAPRAAWLLVLPLLVMATIAPPSLGAYAAARQATVIEQPEFALPPLPAERDGAVDLTLTDFYSRVLYEPDTLQGRTVRMSGFVTPVGDEWFLTRMRLSCCAADGRPIKVLTDGAASRPAPAADTWVEVLGRYTTPRAPAGESEHVAALQVESVRVVPRPQNPYE